MKRVRSGESSTRLYSIWHGMKERCYRKTHDSYKNYGALGVTVTDEWRDNFSAFKQWAVENGYADGLSIDRRETSKGYEPSNCRFVTMAEQALNKRNTIKATIDGKTYLLHELVEITGISYQALRTRYRRGDRDEVLARPPQTKACM